MLAGTPQEGQFEAVRRLGGIRGDSLTGAQAGVDENNQSVVNITFDANGGRKFAQLSTENVGKPFRDHSGWQGALHPRV